MDKDFMCQCCMALNISFRRSINRLRIYTVVCIIFHFGNDSRIVFVSNLVVVHRENEERERERERECGEYTKNVKLLLAQAHQITEFIKSFATFYVQ